VTAYKKLGGVWYPATRIYLKGAGVWWPTDTVYVKRNGAWYIAHNYDVTPPAAPLVSLEIVDTQSPAPGSGLAPANQGGRYIKVGVRMPSTSNDTDVRRIRVLTTYNKKMPTTPFGGTYTARAADSDPHEPWSDTHFNGFSAAPSGRSTAEWKYKRWPRNADNSTNLPAGVEHFAVWAEDFNGNWSQGTFAQITVPKRGTEAANIKVKEARFRPNATGTWSGGSFTHGRPTQATGPVRRGLFLYGNQIKDAIGSQGPATIRKAQIRLERRPDTGRPNANVYLATHKAGTAQAFSNDSSWGKPVKLGQIGKGETKWFDIPEAWYDELAKNGMKGFILLQKDPDKNDAQANDYSVMNSVNDSSRTGELHVVWAERL
jgi:hypothetical protein